jgi:hypothetical protein
VTADEPVEILLKPACDKQSVLFVDLSLNIGDW